ncbi:uncharacterized protein G2W53_041589 [Senna tora]|uniref:Uncharacterized protein n=1 Tax=Senna tora TaxID=362788 RepID=A0A834SF15_9FABA|nr:uncharacterized protein G2W53_041589 [Senna tora]
MLQLASSWHGRSVDHVLTYYEQQIAIGSQKPSRITRRKTCCARESNTSVRVVFANRSGFDAPIAVVMAWEVRGSCLNIFRTTNCCQISETFTNDEAKDSFRESVDHVLTYSGRQIGVGSPKRSRMTRQKTCCARDSNTSVRVVFANRSGLDAPIAVVFAWEERRSCLNMFWTTNHGRISETFTNYKAKDLLRKSLDHVLTYSGQQIGVGSQKRSRMTRQKTCCASESNTLVRVVLANRSGFDDPIGVILAWKERGSCLNIFHTTNRGRISETVTNYEAKDLLHNESNTSVRVVFVNRSAFDAPIAVVLEWEERGSCVNIFRMTNRGQISETFTNYEAKDLLRKSVDYVLTYSGRQIEVGSQIPSQITRQKSCCATNRSGFDAPIGVFLAWEECGSCLNIFRTKNRGRISETFAITRQKTCCANKSRSDLRNLRELGGKRLVGQVSQTRRFVLYLRTGVVLMLQLESSWNGRSVDHVLTYSGQQIAVGSQKPSRITRRKSCCAKESNTSVRVVFPNSSGFDARIAVVFAWEERRSCLNIFRTKNRGRISVTFTNYEAKDLLRKSVDDVLKYSGRQIAVGSQKPSRITRQKICCASESNTSIRVVFPNRSGLDAPIGVVLAWEECGSCLNIFQTTNRGRISETFANLEGKDLLRKIVDHVLTYSGRKIAVRSQKPSRITRRKTCCARESNTSVGVVFANRSGFDAPIAVLLAWEERGSCLNIFRMKNRDRISETFNNDEAKELLCNGFDAPIGVVLAWKERGSCLNILRMSNPGRISETIMNYEAKVLLRKSVVHVLTYSGRQITVGSQKPSRITRRMTCCASESNTSVRVVFANRSGFDAPIAVLLAWEERRSCLNIFQTINRGQISKTFTNYEAKDLLRNESNTSVRVVFANRSGFDAPIAVVMAWEVRGSCLNIFQTTNCGQISKTFTNYEAKDLLRNRLGMGGAWIMSQHVLDDKSRSTLINLHELRGKRLVAQVSQTRRFALYLRTRVVLMLQLESSWHGRSVDHVFTYSGRQIAVGFHKPLRIMRQKTCCASESNTSVRVVFANRSGFDAPITVVMAWQKSGSCLNIFRMENCGRISETFMNYEAKDLLRQ